MIVMLYMHPLICARSQLWHANKLNWTPQLNRKWKVTAAVRADLGEWSGWFRPIERSGTCGQLHVNNQQSSGSIQQASLWLKANRYTGSRVTECPAIKNINLAQLYPTRLYDLDSLNTTARHFFDWQTDFCSMFCCLLHLVSALSLNHFLSVLTGPNWEIFCTTAFNPHN